MESSLIRGFPGISVALEDVQLRDSLWSVHKHDLINARKVYVAVNALSFLSGSVKIMDIELKNAEMYLLPIVQELEILKYSRRKKLPKTKVELIIKSAGYT